MHLCLCCFEFCSVLAFSVLQFYHPDISVADNYTYKDNTKHIYPALSPLQRDFFSVVFIAIIFWSPKRKIYALNLKLWVCGTYRSTVLLQKLLLLQHGFTVLVDKSAVFPTSRWLWLEFHRSLAAVVLQELLSILKPSKSEVSRWEVNLEPHR